MKRFHCVLLCNCMKMKARKQTSILYYYFFWWLYRGQKIVKLLLMRQKQCTWHLGCEADSAFWPLEPAFQAIAGFWSLWNVSINIRCIYSLSSILSHLSLSLYLFQTFFSPLSINWNTENCFPCYSDISEPLIGPSCVPVPLPPPACVSCQPWISVPGLAREGTVWLVVKYGMWLCTFQLFFYSLLCYLTFEK